MEISSWQAFEGQLGAGVPPPVWAGEAQAVRAGDWWASGTAASYLFPGQAHPPCAVQDEAGAVAGDLLSPTAEGNVY